MLLCSFRAARFNCITISVYSGSFSTEAFTTETHFYLLGTFFVSIMLIMSSFFLGVLKDDYYSWLAQPLNAKAFSALLKSLHWVLLIQFLIISIYICFYIFCISFSCSKGVFPCCQSEVLLFEGTSSPGNPLTCGPWPIQRAANWVLPAHIKLIPFWRRFICDLNITSSKDYFSVFLTYYACFGLSDNSFTHICCIFHYVFALYSLILYFPSNLQAVVIAMSSNLLQRLLER